jgi:methylated-DNA-[protein]-cysteine S-methyltransferase
MISYAAILSTPLTKIGLRISDGYVTSLDVLPNHVECITPSDDISKQISEELTRYFRDPTYVMQIKLRAQGTDFQQKVWQALLNIPSGQTLTYGQLAKQLHSAPRAIGQACRTNPIPIIIPCHRIIAANGLGGYAGEREGFKMDIKKWLLSHESHKMELK